MRTNIDIDDTLLEAAMKAGPFKTKKDAVEAGLKLLARQEAYREILRWRGKLAWSDDDTPAAPTTGDAGAMRLTVQEPAPSSARARHGRR